MSQRKALLASIVLTLVLALSAIGIRAAMIDSPDDSVSSGNARPLVVTSSGEELDDDEQYDDEQYDDEHDDEHDDDEDDNEDAFSPDDDDDDRESNRGYENEDDDDD